MIVQEVVFHRIRKDSQGIECLSGNVSLSENVHAFGDDRISCFRQSCNTYFCWFMENPSKSPRDLLVFFSQVTIASVKMGIQIQNDACFQIMPAKLLK